MTKITRSDVYVRSEKGGEWFEDFLQSLAEDKEGSVRDVVDAIQHKKSETVQSVVDEYRKMVGLDSIANSEDSSIIATASSRPLSIRHAQALESDGVISEIEQDSKLKEDVRSLCEHSGGNKNTHAIINFLREKLGRELVSYSDEDLVEYIEEMKKGYQEEPEEQHGNVGKVGIDVEDHPEDNAADYITHGKGI